MSIEFDSIDSGFNTMKRSRNTEENTNQLTIFNYQDLDKSLPSIPNEVVDVLNKSKEANKKKKNKSKKKTKQKVEKQEQQTSLSLSEVKTMKPKKEFEEQGLGKLTITGNTDGRVQENSLIAQVIAQAKHTDEKKLVSINSSKYIKKDGLMTEAEKKLYKFLRKRLPDNVLIMTKVRLADLVDVNKEVTRERKALLQIAYKHVDYVVLSESLEVICAVELDDYTHETAERQQRDRFVEQTLRECNIDFFRIKCKIDLITKEDTKALETCVYEYLAPTCPICGRPMEVKSSKQRHNYGHRFYGCMGFYEPWPNKCTHTIDID